MSKIGIIIQARMGSTRFPEKVLTNIAGRPMIYYLLERMKEVKKADIVKANTGAKK
jgi:spore coat polysaccharide biosynthesis protein SpsF